MERLLEKADTMKNIESLIRKATELKSEGLVEGQISEELNVSRETVTWLLTHGEKSVEAGGPKDISVDWSEIGRSAFRLNNISQALTELVYEVLGESDLDVDVVVGIALSGVPLASQVATHLDVDLAVYMPSKQVASQGTDFHGNLSVNFAGVNGKCCVIIDDVITSGRTLEEAVAYLEEHGAKVNAIVVLIDKKGGERVSGVNVRSLMKVLRVN